MKAESLLQPYTLRENSASCLVALAPSAARVVRRFAIWHERHSRFTGRLDLVFEVHGVYVQQCQLASSLAFKGIIRFPFLIHPILPVLRFPIIYLPPGLIDERRDEFLEILKNGFW